MGGVRKKKKQQPQQQATAAACSIKRSGDEDFWDQFELPEYDGDENGGIGLSEWVSKLETFFDFTGKPDAQRLVYATNLLTAGAHAKWRSLLAQVSAGKVRPVKSWEDFKTHLGRMGDGEGRNEILDADCVVRQGNSCISDYTRKFFGSRKLGRYIAGLNPPAAEYVRSRNPKDFQEAAKLAYEWEYREARTAELDEKCEGSEDDGSCNQANSNSTTSSSSISNSNNYSNESDVWLKGKVNGHSITMAQNKTSDNYISKRLVKLLNLTPFKLEASKADLIARNVAVELEDGFTVWMDFCVVGLGRHDIILGLPFFELFNSIGFHSDHILVDEHRLGLCRGAPS